MVMVFIVLNVCLMEVSQMLNCVASCFTNGVCVVPLAPTVMTRIGSTFHPCRMILSIKG
jgi:hypothetical protein